MLQLREPAYTHSTSVVAAQPDFVALNSALEVSLLGEVNAETVSEANGRWRHVGGVGGLSEFVRAAVQAPRGQSVIALASRTPRGRPRVVARLSGPATLAATDADLVVTEHGVACLRHASMAQRVRQMIAIAHPEDRNSLQSEARAFGLA
jgi:acetyl-CoA hydrolase